MAKVKKAEKNSEQINKRKLEINNLKKEYQVKIETLKKEQDNKIQAINDANENLTPNPNIDSDINDVKKTSQAQIKTLKLELKNKIKDIKIAESEKKVRKEFKNSARNLNKITKEHSQAILAGNIVSINNNNPNTEENIIELFDVKKSYLTGDLEYEVLKGVNLAIKKETFVVILGPSGSGKTTLLNIISGLDKANQGDVFVSGYNLSLLKDNHLTKFRRDNVGFIFQQYNLLTNLTAKENAEVGENLAKEKNQALSIDEIFKVIEMDEHMNKFPSQLSGGQQQRVSIGRALAKNPKILFCDEPTGALDEEMGRKVLEILLNVNKEFKTSVIMVTHNPNFQYVADTVINVRNGVITSVKHNSNPKKPSEINWG